MDRTAVITGAASGIGLKTAERLLREGWTVWGLDRSAAQLRAASERLAAAEGRFHHVECDVASASSTADAFAQIGSATRRIDALIASAGVFRTGALEATTPDDVDLILGVNIKGPWLSVRTALPLLRHGATPDDPSRVVIIGSCAGIRPSVGVGMYAASKAAIHAITGVMAVELAPGGITVNAVAPGVTETPMVSAMLEASSRAQGQFKLTSPLGRIGQTDDIAGVVAFLLGNDAKYVNGVVIPVDGGTRAAHAG